MRGLLDLHALLGRFDLFLRAFLQIVIGHFKLLNYLALEGLPLLLDGRCVI